MDDENLKYPIGRFVIPEQLTLADQQQYIKQIEGFPERLRKVAENLDEGQLNIRYRTDGWTARQVIHHCADSHMNAIIRFKKALTERGPIITGYHEAIWAELPDGKNPPIASSLAILSGVHFRWAELMRTLSESDLDKAYYHPEKGRMVMLREVIPMYAWHCSHHLAHVCIVAGKV